MTLDIKRILVPLDFSANSQAALDYARAVARQFSAALHLVHVCEVLPAYTGSLDGGAIAVAEWSRQLGEDAETALARIARTITDAPVSTEVLFGNPARAIVTAAQADRSDLIVMGTHGRGAVMHLLMGNVAERVVRTAPCPVLTVRHPEDVVAAEPATTDALADTSSRVCALG